MHMCLSICKSSLRVASWCSYPTLPDRPSGAVGESKSGRGKVYLLDKRSTCRTASGREGASWGASSTYFLKAASAAASKLIEALEEHDDVKEVYSNAEFPET